MDVSELKPCPFCGSRAGLFKYEAYKILPYSVECLNLSCKISTRTYAADIEAITVWNNRKVDISDDTPPATCDLTECWHHVKVFLNGDKGWSCSSQEKGRSGKAGCAGYKERKVGTA